MKIVLCFLAASFFVSQCLARRLDLIQLADVGTELAATSSSDTECASTSDIVDKALLLVENTASLVRKISDTYEIFSNGTSSSCSNAAGCIVTKLFENKNLLLSVVDGVELQVLVIEDLVGIYQNRTNCSSS